MTRYRWFLALCFAAAVGAAGYAAGLPSPFVYLLRGVARHFAYGGH